MPPPERRNALLHRRGVSAAIFRDGRVLLVRRAKPPLAGVWSLPGGHLMATETALAAAHRELKEEAGVEAELKGIVDVRDVVQLHADATASARYEITVFYGTWLRGKARAASDCSHARWAEPAALGAYQLTEGLRTVVAKAAHLLARSPTLAGVSGLQGDP